MTPLVFAEFVAVTLVGSMAALTAVAAVRRRAPLLPAAALLLLIAASGGAALTPVADWVLRDLWLVAVAVLLATYPDGRFVPGWTRWVTVAGTVGAVADATTAASLFGASAPVLFTTLGVGLLACQVHRYRRRSAVDERTRVRWPILLTGWALVGFLALGVWTSGAIGTGDGWPAAAAMWLALLVPAGFVIGLVRPQLVDVDHLLRRSVSSLALAMVTGGAYLAAREVGSLFVGTRGAELAAAIAAVLTALSVRRAASLLADRVVGATTPDPVRTLASLGESFERSLDARDLASSIATMVMESLRLRTVEVAVRDLASVSTGGEPDGLETFIVLHQGEQVGALRAGPRAGEAGLTTQDRALLRLVANHAGSAMYAAGVVADLRRARERLVFAREEERRRLRRDLHDELAPQLAGLALSGAAVQQYVDRDVARATELAGRLVDDLRRATQQVRDIAYDLRPSMLDDLGLTAAITDRVARGPEDNGLKVMVDAPEERFELPAALELAALRIVQEAVTNTRKHAAASECRIVLRSNSNELHVDIEDNGRGFTPMSRPGVGLGSMRERAEELGGTCEVTSRSTGTRVSVTLPIGATAGA